MISLTRRRLTLLGGNNMYVLRASPFHIRRGLLDACPGSQPMHTLLRTSRGLGHAANLIARHVLE